MVAPMSRATAAAAARRPSRTHSPPQAKPGRSATATLLIDTSPRPEPLAERVARELGARYLPLPHADASAMSRAVLAATAS